MPLRSSRCFIQAGVGAFGVDAFDHAAREARAGVRRPRCARDASPSVVDRRRRDGGGDSGAPVIAATSRAMPRIDRQSARLGVSLSVSSVSSSASASRRSRPGRQRSSGRTSRPRRIVAECRAPSPSTACPATRRRAPSASLIASPPGSVAPSTRAAAPSCPAAAFGAPHTIVQRARAARVDRAHAQPIGIRDAARRFRCARRRRRRTAGAAGSRCSTSSPAIVSASASAARVERRVRHRAQPVFGELHRCARQANWRRKRRSFS